MSNLDNVRFIISSYGRPTNQITLKNLPKEIRDRVELWVRPEEFAAYRSSNPKVKLIKWPDEVDSIYKKRAWLSKRMEDPHLMLDDDLQLSAWSGKVGKYVTSKDDPDLLTRAIDRGLLPLFDKYDMVSCPMKFMADQYVKSSGFIKTGQPGYVVNGYNPNACEGVDFRRTHFLSDMNQGIQAIQNGKTSATFYGIVFSQSTAKFLGSSGCATQRTPFLKVDASLRMLHFYPGIVTDVKENSATNGGGITLVKRLSRLSSGVTKKHRDESTNRLAELLRSFGLSRLPEPLRWSMKETTKDFELRIQDEWRAAGFSGNFNNITITS